MLHFGVGLNIKKIIAEDRISFYINLTLKPDIIIQTVEKANSGRQQLQVDEFIKEVC